MPNVTPLYRAYRIQDDLHIKIKSNHPVHLDFNITIFKALNLILRYRLITKF